MKRQLLFIVFLGQTVAMAQTRDTLQQIDQLFSRWNNATPGGSVLVARNDKILYHKAFGLADLEHNVPNTTETIFEGGSVSKQFTAAATLQLVAEGKVGLKDDVRKYIPELPGYGTTITVQHLLNHTSGLKDWGSIGAMAGWPRTTKVYTQALALQTIWRQKSLNFTPGAEYSYSNANYSLLVSIVERVSGKSLAEFTAEKFFVPLGMKTTKWRNNFREVVPNRSVAYRRSMGVYEQEMPFEHVHGHGGLLTTTGDLLIWNRQLELKKIGGPDTYNHRVTKGKLNNGREISYASGLFIERRNGVEEISHSGATAGYRAWLAYYPAKKLTVVVLSNDGSFNPVGTGLQISELYVGKAVNSTTEKKYISLAEADLSRFKGTYKSIRGFDVMDLEVKEGKIVRGSRTYNAVHRDTLYADNITLALVKPGRILLRNPGDTSTYVKVAAPLQGVNSYAGTYHSIEADATFLIEVKNNEMWLTSQPNPAYKLTPSFADAFVDASSDLYEFKKGKKGDVTGLEVSTGRAERIQFTKVNAKP